MPPPEGKHPQKAAPRGSASPAIDRPESSASARTPHGSKGPEKPQGPRSASEPPKRVSRQGVHPTTRSAEGSSDVTRRAATDKKYSPTLKEPRSPKRQNGRTPAQLSKDDVDKIERQTLGQRDNQEWYHWRQNRITASLAHQVAHSKFANRKTNDIPQSYLKAILGTAPSVQTAAMNWGIRNEEKAVAVYERLASCNKGRKVRVEPCGLFIHPTKNWLAASPDGLVKDVHTGQTLNIVEVKCPYKHRERTVHEACKDRNFCLTLDGDFYILKPQHAYYTQVQCQMAVTGIGEADFVVHTNKETAVVPVKFAVEFWKETEPKLERFYVEAVLPNVKGGGTDREPAQNKAVYGPEE